MDANELAKRVAHSMLAAEGTGPAWGLKIEEVREDYARVSMVILADSAFAYVCNGANHASVAAQASIVFLDKVREGETLIAEATEVAREGRAGITRVAVTAGDGRKVAEFTGYSRTLGGPVVEIDTLS